MSALSLCVSLLVLCVIGVFSISTKTMAAARFLWASRVASHLRISVAQRGFASGESQFHDVWFVHAVIIESEIVPSRNDVFLVVVVDI